MTWHLSFFHSDEEPVQVVEKVDELPASAVLEVTWEGNNASLTVPPIPSLSTSSAFILPLVQTNSPALGLTSTPSSSLSQPRRELFTENNYTAKRRKLDMELEEINLEIGKAQLALLRAQTTKAAIETKALELECEERALEITRQRASITCQPTNFL